jgi:hypothetical protein
MEAILNKLAEAISTGELINIIYHGGSEPGTARMIMPIKIEGDKVRARCYASNKVKAFSLEKIEFAADDISDYTGTHQEPASLEEAITPYLDELKAAGWDIELTSDSVRLFTFFKNGKRRKTSELSLSYYIPQEHYEFDEPEAVEEPDGINQRPWHVQGHAYKYLSKAVSKFLKLAREQKTLILKIQIEL